MIMISILNCLVDSSMTIIF